MYVLTAYIAIVLVLLTPGSKAFREKLTVAQLVMEFLASRGIGKFITIFTRAHYWCLAYAR
jgi:hypothetical protein